MNRMYNFFCHFLFILLLVLLSPALSSAEDAEASTPAGLVFEKAKSKILQGDSAAALGLFNQALTLDPKNYESWLARGRLLLAQGNLDAAGEDFTNALLSESNRIRALAHIGLGDIQRQKPAKNWEAIEEYRLALSADPGNREALYAISQAGLAMKFPKGYRTASEALLDLACIDPCYKDVYSTWRDTILDKTPDELRWVCPCLENYLAEHPEKNAWLLDIASYHFQLDEIRDALAALDKLENILPGYEPVERHLLRARCMLEVNDTIGFEASYQKALQAAGKEGNFESLVIQAEAIFRPEEQEKVKRLKTVEQWEDFFRVFWGRRDLDPLTPWNERLFEHYKRLRQAEKLYTVKNPYPNRFKNSHDYYRLVLSNENVEAPVTAPKYDPDIFWDRCRKLALEERGLLYMRHGPPDEKRLPGPERYREDGSMYLAGGPPSENSIEVWRYGTAFFPFEAIMGAEGDYVFVPAYVRGIGNITKAMETDTYKDPLPQFKQDFYGADFLARDGKIEMELYQSVPASVVPLPEAPGISLAVFDLSWKEIARDSSGTVKIFTGGDSIWIGINRLKLEPGNCIYAARIAIPGRRAVKRKSLNLFPYRGKGLELSGVILGSPPESGVRVHRKNGVDILPRPSLKFMKDEIITVYLELYGLKEDNTGQRHYTERVTVTRTGKETKGEPGQSDNIKRLASYGKKSSGSLTLSFERESADTTGPVAEHFTIDTSFLVPGSYRMKIEVVDRSTRGKKSTGCFFELKER